MQIMYAKKASGTYATACDSVRIDGKVQKINRIYLGKVIDKEKGIYENKKLGLITFDPKTGAFGKPDLAQVPARAPRGKKLTSADFGDAYVLDRYVTDMGMEAVIDSFGCQNPDTMKALMMYYILHDEPNDYALDWFEGSYASVLYPKADMDGRRISEFLFMLGADDMMKSFFHFYIPFVLSTGTSLSFMIDSTGVPNSIHMPETAISNHNGKISLEVRLILVCKKEDRMPVYFRYVPGNIIDSSTLIRTVEELELMGVEISNVLIDAGYCTLENMRDLIDSHIHFITRLRPNYDMYKDMIADDLFRLDSLNTRVLYKDRFMRVFSKEVKMKGSGNKVWLHLILDEDMKNSQDKTSFQRWQDGRITEEQRDEEYRTNGVFILVSSYWIEREEVVADYYERGGIEQLIDVGKTDCRLGEGNVQDIQRLRGKWLVEFSAMAVQQSMQNAFKVRKEYLSSRKRKHKDAIEGRNMCVSHALFVLRNQKCDIFESVVLPRERTPNVSAAYTLFNIDPPKRLDKDSA